MVSDAREIQKLDIAVTDVYAVCQFTFSCFIVILNLSFIMLLLFFCFLCIT